VKFRDETGRTWGGIGKRPQWLRDALAAGKSLQDFAVQ
jgi:DNA-binding protein H-NS